MLAHYSVAQSARAQLAPGPLADLLAEAPDAYAVGAQGPDFLFYSRLWRDGRGRSDLAFLVHQQRMDQTVAAMLAFAAEAPAADRAALHAFACGYASHICLDAGAHPWVLYWTGDVSGGVGSPEAAAAMRRHGILEASVDVALAARHRPAGFSWPRSRRLLSLAPPRRRAVAGMWAAVMRDVHDLPFTARETDAALRAMAAIYGQMTDRRSPLSLLVRVAGRVVDGHGVARAQVYPARPHPAAASLVEERRAWRCPSRPAEPRTQTFAELCDRASLDTLACLRAVERLLAGDGDAGDVLAVIGDRNMITGVPCGDPQRPAAFAPGLEDLWRDA
jgi:hypothetical protein